MRLLDVDYRVVKMAADMRGNLEDGSKKWKLLKTGPAEREVLEACAVHRNSRAVSCKSTEEASACLRLLFLFCFMSASCLSCPLFSAIEYILIVQYSIEQS